MPKRLQQASPRSLGQMSCFKEQNGALTGGLYAGILRDTDIRNCHLHFLWSVDTLRNEEKHKSSTNGFPAVAASHSVSKRLFLTFLGHDLFPFLISVASILRIASSCLSATSVFWYPI